MASATSTSHPPSGKGGRLYVCGRTGCNGKPLQPMDPKNVDNHGHCVYPKPLYVQDPNVRFSHVKGEHLAMSAALESSPNRGALWCWTQNSSEIVRVIPNGVVSFAVGASFALAAMQDGSLLIVGSIPRLDAGTSVTSAGTTDDLTPRPFKVQPPKGVTHVSASELNIAIICGDAGEVYTIGNNAAGNGHGISGLAEWKQIKLLSSKIIGSSDAVSSSTVNVANDAAVAIGNNINNNASSDEKSLKAVFVAQGSLHGGAITSCGKVFLWGDGQSGTLGTGSRTRQSEKGIAIGHDFVKQFNDPAVHLACTTSQLNPKRTISGKGADVGPGQEGPRTHVVTKSGALYICGTTHKGMGACCLYKTLGADQDLLSFYKVGGAAMDYKSMTKCPTGGAEDLGRSKDAAPPQVIARRCGMASVEDYGKDKNTGYLSEPGLKIISSQPTHIHSVAVSEDGRCFSFGCGSDGRTGLAGFMRGPSGSKRLMKCYVSTPSVVESLEHQRVLDACACRNYTLFVVE